MNEKNIAIVGVACRFSGAKDKDEYWHNLANNINSISQIKAERWDWEKRACHVDARNKAAAQWLATIDDVDCFDYQFFGIAPIDAQGMDPQQRIMIELAWHCFEDAGMNIDKLPTRNVGVYIAGFNYDYKQLQDTHPHTLGTEYSTGASCGIIASRVSYHLNLQGPSFVLDTACSGSLETINSAIQAIDTGNCEMALAGGVSLVFTENRHHTFALTGMLSNKGRCNTFDDKADGYVRGEGAGIVLLKPADKALKDDDRIYGIIKGCKTNHTGMQAQSKSISYPISYRQADVITAAHLQAGFAVESISFIETHGTGTPKGDPIEIEGLCNAFKQIAQDSGATEKTSYCYLGAVKANIGHLESAAGIAGLIKVLLCFEHKQIPPLCGFETLNKKIQLEGSPFVIDDRLNEWATLKDNEGKPYPKRAGVSSFGFGGTNGHLAVEQAPHVYETNTYRKNAKPFPAYLLTLSAKTENALFNRRKELYNWLIKHKDTDLTSLSRTLLTGRVHFDIREAYIVDSVDDAIEKIQRVSSLSDTSDFFYSNTNTKDNTQSQSIFFAKAATLIEQLGARKRPVKAVYLTKLQQLAQAYTAGLDVGWQPLFKYRYSYLLSLPGYPFAKSRCWLEQQEGEIPDSTQARLHPLVHTNTSTAKEPRFSSIFKKDEADATDYPIMARVAIANMMGLAADDKRIGFTQFIACLPLPADGQTVLHVGIYLKEKQQCSFEIYSLSTTENNQESETIFCSGEATWGEERPTSGSQSRVIIEEEAILAQCKKRVLNGKTEPGVILLAPEWMSTPLSPTTVKSQHYDRHIVIAIDLAKIYQNTIKKQFKKADCHFLNIDKSEQDVAMSFQYYAATVLIHIQNMLKEIKQSSKNKVLFQVIIPGENSKSWLNALAGMLLVLRKEQSRIVPQLISIECNNNAGSLVEVLKQNGLHTTDLQIRYQKGERQLFQWKEASSWKNNSNENSLSPWQNNKTYLITGGAGGIGLILAKTIAAKVKSPTLILTGRSKLSIVHSEAISTLTQLGANVVYYSADVADKEAINALIDNIQTQQGPLDGIIHAAGIMQNSWIKDKTPEQFQQVLNPKVNGVIYLDQATQNLRLDFFICCASVAGALGDVGQIDYAAANAFLDIFAHYRNALVEMGERYGKTLALDWPLWAEGGMQVDEASVKQLKHQWGMVPMSTAAGIAALNTAMSSKHSQLLVMEGDLKTIRRKLLADDNDNNDNDTVATATTDSLEPLIRQALCEMAAKTLGTAADQIDSTAIYNDMGFSSVLLTRFTNRLNDSYDTELTAAELFEYTTIKELVNYLLVEYPDQMLTHFGSKQKTDNQADEAAQTSTKVTSKRQQYLNRADNSLQSNQTNHEPIAIIGMSGCYPMAPDLQTLAENLAAGKDCISEVPASRWDWCSIYGDIDDDGNHTPYKWGGFIDGVDQFDPLFFNISPKEAEQMDPQQRLTLTYAWKVLEDAAYSPSSLRGTNTGIFIGTASSDYASLMTSRQIDGYSLTSQACTIAPNRVSYLLDLYGPSEPIDTACSSSLVAVHHAMRAIQNGECDMAIAGGVNTLLSQEFHIARSKAGMLSKDGRCHTFSANANGYVPGEGVGMLLLKPLSSAERDGDAVYALLRGSAIQHGGAANSLTAPRPERQAALISAVYQQAGIDPRHIGYIETHGTGTPLGDPVEINGLKAAFKTLYQDHDIEGGFEDNAASHCGLGAVKSNLGHLELAAGVAGLTKVILQLQTKTLYPSLHCEDINPQIKLANTPLHIVQEKQAWPAPVDEQGNELPRIAGVSSFGFGGVNAHVIVEEYVAQVEAYHPENQEPVLVLLSAKNEQRLQDTVKNLVVYLHKKPTISLNNLAYTLQVGRDAMEQRLAIIADSVSALVNILTSYLQNNDHNDNAYRAKGDGQTKKFKDVLATFTNDEIFKASLVNWLQQKNYHKLAKLWTQGLNIEWTNLYADTLPQRISLPTYPFAKERYWMSEFDQRPKINGKTNGSNTQYFDAVLTNKTDTKDYITGLIAEGTSIPIDEIEDDVHFMELGADSIILAKIIKEIKKQFDVNVNNQQLYDKLSNIRALSDYIEEKKPKTQIKEGTKVIAKNHADNNIKAHIIELISEGTSIPIDEIDDDTHFMELGADSIVLAKIIKEIKKQFDVNVNNQQLYDDLSTVRDLANHVEEQISKIQIDNNNGVLTKHQSVNTNKKISSSGLIEESL